MERKEAQAMERKNYAGYVGARLPEEFEMRAGELFYEDVYYSCREQVLNVREDGPDAWGDCVDVPPGSFVRTIGYDGNPGKWHYVTEGERRWITMIGSKVEYIHIRPDQSLDWYLGRAVEW